MLQVALQEIRELSTDDYQALRLSCMSSTEGGAFPLGAPFTKFRTKLDNAAFLCSIRFRLGQPVAAESVCSCGHRLYPLGAHALVCRRNPGKHIRHRLINKCVRDCFQQAELPTLLKPVGLSRADGKRPDGVTVLPYSNGRALSWDVTCVHPLVDSYVATGSKE